MFNFAPRETSRPGLRNRYASEAQGRHREVGSEGSVEQNRDLTSRNRIRGRRTRTSSPPPRLSTGSCIIAWSSNSAKIWKACELLLQLAEIAVRPVPWLCRSNHV